MNNKELHKRIGSLLATESLAVLATKGDVYPYTSLVSFAVMPDLMGIIFATSRATQKFKNMQQDRHVSLLVDNARYKKTTKYVSMAVTVLGEWEEVAGDDRAALAHRLLFVHPHLAEFVGHPDCAIVKIVVMKYILVSGFDVIEELVMK